MGMTSFHNPPYYNRGKIQVWDFIRDQQLNYHLGNVIKYVCRAGHKRTVGNPTGDPLEDLDKAIHYLINERDYLRHGSNNHPGHTPDFLKRPSEGVPRNIPGRELDQSGESFETERSDRRGI